jgi:hypothetical protein
MDSQEYTAFVFYYIISVISILLNLIIVFYLIKTGWKKENRIFTELLVILHHSIAAENFTALPFIFKFNEGLCLAIESLKFYFGLKNILVIFVLIRTYSMSLNNQLERLSPHFQYWRHVFLLVFPMIVFLPYISHTYEIPSHPWCSLPYDHGVLAAVLVQYSWVWALIAYTIAVNCKILYRLFRNYNPVLFNTYVEMVLSYSIISSVSWVPRTIIRFANGEKGGSVEQSFAAYFPMMISGILFALLFYRNFEGINSFEEQLSLQQSQQDSELRISALDFAEFLDDFKNRTSRESRASRASKMSTANNPIFALQETQKKSKSGDAILTQSNSEINEA